MDTERGLTADVISRDLELSAFLEERYTGCQYPTDNTIIGFDLPDFLILDSSSKTIKPQRELSCYAENPTNYDTSIQRKSIIEDRASSLDISQGFFLDDNSRSISHRGTDKFDEMLDELLSHLEPDRRLTTTPKTKKRRTTDSDEALAMPIVYNCNYCSAKFYNKIACHHHQVCHAKKLLRCRYCSKRSRSYNELRRHVEYHHGVPKSRRDLFIF